MLFVVLFVVFKVVRRTTFQRGFMTDVTSFLNDPSFEDSDETPAPKGIKGVGIRIMRAVF